MFIFPSESDVFGLVADLANKAAAVHTHDAADIVSGMLVVDRGGTGTGTALASGSIVVASSGGVYSNDPANLFWDWTYLRLGVTTNTPREALDLGGGRLVGGTYSAGQEIVLDLSAVGSFPGCQFLFPGTGVFMVAEVGVAGTGDVFFQATPATAAGYGYLEAWQGAGLIVGTGSGGGAGGPVILRPQRATATQAVLDATGLFTLGGPVRVGRFTVASLPTPGTAGRVAFATNGRKPGEGAGAGTGVVVSDDGTNWIASGTGLAVTA
jgi:hypothetical protein